MDARVAAIVGRVASVPGLRFAALFGSAAVGRAAPGGDLDIAHGYARIDPARLRESAAAGIAELECFLAEIARWDTGK